MGAFDLGRITGLAIALRPRVMLFLPALASAVDEGAGCPHEPWTKGVRRELLAYLRRLDPEIRVANVLRTLPFPSINGPAGRVTPFPAAVGVIHLGLGDPNLGKPASPKRWKRRPSS